MMAPTNRRGGTKTTVKTLPGVQPLPDRVDVAHGMGVDRSVGQMTASRAGAGYIEGGHGGESY